MARHGVARWLRYPALDGDGSAVLEINGTAYLVVPVADGQFNLAKIGGGEEVYRLQRCFTDAGDERWVCDCRDALHRGQGCKHANALLAAERNLNRKKARNGSEAANRQV